METHMVSEQRLPSPSPGELEQRRGLLAVRVLYFLYFAGVGAYWIFLNVYYASLGMSGTQIGVVNTLAPLTAIVAATLWGVLSDRLGQPRKVLRIAIPGVIVSTLLLSTARPFGLIILFACLVALFNSATIPLLDNTTLRLLGERRGQYGRYRVLGSVGFILTSLAAGYLYEVTGLTWIFYVYALIMLGLVLAAAGLPHQPVRLAGSSVWSGLGQMVRQPAWLMFAIASTLLWIANNGTMNFLGITIEQMGGAERLIGLASMVSAVAEIPIMVYSERLLRRIGPAWLQVAAFALFVARGALLAVMPRPEWAIGAGVLGGVGFAFYWISAVAYAHESAPEHLKSTAQALLFSLLNLAGMAGSLFSGWLFDQAGHSGLFWAMAASSALGLVVFGWGQVRYTHAEQDSPL
jgi:PPP family 3-phenylpropionic acid transporter